MQIVISRYSEDIQWSASFSHCIIYNKGDPVDSPHPVITLPNVGREGHTYLHHIIQNYDHLDDYTVFLQGYPFDHSPYLEDILKELHGRIKKNEYIPFHIISKDIYRIYVNYHEGDVFGHPLVGPIYTQLMGPVDDTKTIEFGAGAHFLVSKAIILSRPKAFYEAMLSLLDKECGPVEGYAVERLWSAVFRQCD